MNFAIYGFIAYFLDLIFGDPKKIPHPICFIGKLISITENAIREALPKTFIWERIGGGLLSFVVMSISFCLPYYLLLVLYGITPFLGGAVEIFFCFQILATKSLKDAALSVYMELAKGNIPSARNKLSMIVGRDTANLEQADIIKATVETTAENTSDGVIAPLIFILIGGAPLGFLYKSINTMDSMVGYRNDKYKYFGTIPARIDDIANFIPARITAIFYLVAGAILNLNWRKGYKMWRRDGNKHSSPNSGVIEATCAGLLGIQLGGGSYYFGKFTQKPTLGDDSRKPEPKDIITATRLLYLSTLIATIILSGIGVII